MKKLIITVFILVILYMVLDRFVPVFLQTHIVAAFVEFFKILIGGSAA